MRRLRQMIFVAVGFAGFVAFTHVSDERRTSWGWESGPGRYELHGGTEARRIGVPGSPWYEEVSCGVPWCGTMNRRLNWWSWSWPALGVGVAGLLLGTRRV